MFKKINAIESESPFVQSCDINVFYHVRMFGNSRAFITKWEFCLIMKCVHFYYSSVTLLVTLFKPAYLYADLLAVIK